MTPPSTRTGKTIGWTSMDLRIAMLGSMIPVKTATGNAGPACELREAVRAGK